MEMLSFNYSDVIMSDDGALRSVSQEDNYEIISFYPSQSKTLLEESEEFQATVINKDKSNKRHKNYLPQRFNIVQCFMVSLVKKNDVVVGISTLLGKEFYGLNKARCLNRYYVSPEERVNSFTMRFPVEMIRHQVFGAKLLGLTYVFISIELFKNNWIENFKNLLDAKLLLNWVDTGVAHLVCENEKDLSCWQHVLYCSIEQSACRRFKINKIATYGAIRVIYSID